MLFATLVNTFGGMKRTVKMHLLEDHIMEWMSTHQAGCGLMGEQGVESIHAKFRPEITTPTDQHGTVPPREPRNLEEPEVLSDL